MAVPEELGRTSRAGEDGVDRVFAPRDGGGMESTPTVFVSKASLNRARKLGMEPIIHLEGVFGRARCGIAHLRHCREMSVVEAMEIPRARLCKCCADRYAPAVPRRIRDQILERRWRRREEERTSPGSSRAFS